MSFLSGAFKSVGFGRDRTNEQAKGSGENGSRETLEPENEVPKKKSQKATLQDFLIDSSSDEDVDIYKVPPPAKKRKRLYSVSKSGDAPNSQFQQSP